MRENSQKGSGIISPWPNGLYAGLCVKNPAASKMCYPAQLTLSRAPSGAILADSVDFCDERRGQRWQSILRTGLLHFLQCSLQTADHLRQPIGHFADLPAITGFGVKFRGSGGGLAQ